MPGVASAYRHYAGWLEDQLLKSVRRMLANTASEAAHAVTPAEPTPAPTPAAKPSATPPVHTPAQPSPAAQATPQARPLPPAYIRALAKTPVRRITTPARVTPAGSTAARPSSAAAADVPTTLPAPPAATPLPPSGSMPSGGGCPQWPQPPSQPRWCSCGATRQTSGAMRPSAQRLPAVQGHHGAWQPLLGDCFVIVESC